MQGISGKRPRSLLLRHSGAVRWDAREAARSSRKGADKYHDLVTEMLETAIRRVGNEYADMLFEYDQQRREAEKQCEQLAMEGMMKK